ncbi:hypothetical protein EJB05_33430, partial [Eragrostis curvula]
MSGTGCLSAAGQAALSRACRDGAAAARLKTGSLLAILVASAVGICLPVALTRAFRGRAGYARGLLLVKCYAAGVILSTSLVHVLPDAQAALADCAVASRRPWRDFPFSGLFTLFGALLALLVDLSASSHLEAHGHLAGEMSPRKRAFVDDHDDPAPHFSATANGGDTDRDDVALFGAKKGGPALVRSDEVSVVGGGGCHGGGHQVQLEVGEGEGEGEEEEARKKQKMVSKVLEIGIVFHSVIIGVTMGMSQDVCAIRPLVVALSFHQVFEGMGLGGCIAQIKLAIYYFNSELERLADITVSARWGIFLIELDLISALCAPEPLYNFRMILGGRILVAGFGMATVGYMCIMFSVTTPLGILLGMAVFHMTGYDDSSPNALIMEGILGSLSAGVLIYMALVDLISLDFFHNKMMSSSVKLKKASYIALVLGSASMSVLALWA